MSRRLAVALLGPLVLAAGCAAVAPGSGAPPAPQTPWTPPPPATAALAPASPRAALPEPLALADAIALALENSPETRAAWHDAQAAAARYGAAQGAWWPTLDGEATATRGNAATGDWATSTTAGARLSYLLLDFGGRTGSVDAARQALFAANWTHSAALNDRVLAVETAYFAHAGAQAIVAANRSSLADAERSLAAAEARHTLGLATIADVLQARTALSQVRLELQTAEGAERTTRGALALAMGYPAHTPVAVAIAAEVPPPAASAAATAAAEQLIARAIAARPELQAARARAREAAAAARAARAALLPSLSLGAFGNRTWLEDGDDPFDRSSAALTLDIPLFAGLSRRNAARAAAARAAAAEERARGLEQGVIFAVFVAQSDFQTATERLATSADLLASATESERVAAGRYQEGVGSVLDLLSAQRALAAARAQAVGARLDWSTALARLAHDIGSLDPRAAGFLEAQE